MRRGATALAVAGVLALGACSGSEVETGGGGTSADVGTSTSPSSSTSSSSTTRSTAGPAYPGDMTEQEREAAQEALAEARQRWEDTGITSYTWTVDLLCFCGPLGPLQVTVRDGEVAETTPLDPRVEAGQDELPTATTVEDLFQKAEDALTSEDSGAVSITYDETYGYPTKMDIDWIRDAVDDEDTWEASDLTPLP